MAFLVSDKEGRPIVGRQWALREGKGDAAGHQFHTARKTLSLGDWP